MRTMFNTALPLGFSRFSLLSFCLSLLLRLSHPCTDAVDKPKEKMNTTELLSMYGVRSQQHDVLTEDGYRLRLYRLLRSKTEVKKGHGRLPVLVQHGLLCDSDIWLLRGPGKDLPFALMKAGYDVWLGNVRGNKYCKSHVKFNDSEPDFWNYSFHEMGYYDVPAMIDHILRVTLAPQLIYVGHSMGTTMFYVMGATRPQYNAKVRAMFSLAPSAFMFEYKGLLKRFAKQGKQIQKILEDRRIFEVLPRTPWVVQAAVDFCRDGSRFQQVCLDIMFAIGGRDNGQLNATMLPMIIEHLSSANPRTLSHYSQIINSGRFQKYDFGPEGNLIKYGTREAPDYDLSKITVPISIHYSSNDFLSPEKDVERLARSLPNVLGMFKVPHKQFNHHDYVFAKDANTLLYKHVIQIMSKL